MARIDARVRCSRPQVTTDSTASHTLSQEVWKDSAVSCQESLSPKTIRRHVDNLWLLGAEIIRDLNYDPSLRKVAAQQLLRNVVGVDGGPLIYNGSEEEQRSLDSTCRKLHRFLLFNLNAEPTSYPQITQTKLFFYYNQISSRTEARWDVPSLPAGV